MPNIQITIDIPGQDSSVTADVDPDALSTVAPINAIGKQLEDQGLKLEGDDWSESVITIVEDGQVAFQGTLEDYMIQTNVGLNLDDGVLSATPLQDIDGTVIEASEITYNDRTMEQVLATPNPALSP